MGTYKDIKVAMAMHCIGAGFASIILTTMLLLPQCAGFKGSLSAFALGSLPKSYFSSFDGRPIFGHKGQSRAHHGVIRMTDDGDIDMSAFFAEGERREDSPGGGRAMDGPELRSLVMDKWKYPLDTRIHRRRDAFGKQTVWLEVMWKHLWEQS